MQTSQRWIKFIFFQTGPQLPSTSRLTIDSLNDESLFGSVQGDLSLHQEAGIVLGEDDNDDNSSDGEAVVFQDEVSEVDSDDSDDDGNDATMLYGRQILWQWGEA